MGMATNSKRLSKNTDPAIGCSIEVHRGVAREATERGMSRRQILDAIWRGWSMLTPAQRDDALLNRATKD